MSLYQRAKEALLGPEQTPAETQASTQDIDMDALTALMDQLAGQNVPEAQIVAELWPRLGSSGQELVLNDGTMGPKLLGLGLQGSETATLDQASSSLGAAAGPAAGNRNRRTDAGGAAHEAPALGAPVEVERQTVLRPGGEMYSDRAFSDKSIIQSATPVEVLETVREPREITTSGAQEAGFIDKYHVRSIDPEGPAIDHWVGFTGMAVDMELSETFRAQEQIPIDELSVRDRKLATIWNEKGAFIDSARGDIDRAVAVAVMKVESGGMGYSGVGDMVIRFENHKFFRTGEGISKSWGRENQETYNNHFRPKSGATEHEFNRQGADAGGEWTRFHGSQTMEWEALQLAIDVSGDAEAAYCAISMGAGQIMGFNAQNQGYGSAEEMFEAMNTDAAANLGGIFSFIQANEKAKAALDAQDYVAFAAEYNGARYAADYGRMIGTAVDQFRRLEAEHLNGAS